MPRKKLDGFADLYSDIPAVPGGRLALDAAAEETRERLQASTRPDMAGAPVNLLLTPQSYQQRVMRVWDSYSMDPLFQRLVNRVIEFAANGSQWEVPADSSDVSWLKKLKRWVTLRESKIEKEEEFWNTWSGMINLGVPNVLPGLNEVVKWSVKHVLLSGMWVPHWKLGTLKVGKQTYIVPTLMTCYPASAVTLRRTSGMFMEEDVFYLRPVNQTTSMMEGQFIEAPTYLPRTQGVPANMVALPPMSRESVEGDSEAFILKHNWSPGDIVGIRRGQIQTTGAGVYPMPPFYSLLPQFVIRQKLFASDVSILDGIINLLMIYKIGDKDHPPKPPQLRPDGTILQDGTIAQVRKLIQEGRTGPAMELFVPYYVDLVIKMPETGTLVSDAKYGPSATEILQCFRPDQIVTTRRGHIPISKVVVGDEVLTHRGRWHRVAQVHVREYQGELIGLGSVGAKRMWCTPGHSILSRYRKKSVIWHSTQKAWRWNLLRSSKPEPALWKLASTVEGGDQVLLPVDVASYEEAVPRWSLASHHTLEEAGLLYPTLTGRYGASIPRPVGRRHHLGIGVPTMVEVDEPLAEVLGLYLAEGCVVRRQRHRQEELTEAIVFAFHRKESDLHDLVIRVLRERFGVRPKLSFIGNTARLIAHSRVLAEAFAREFQCGAPQKSAPEWLRRAPRRIIAAWIRGLFKGDGHRTSGGTWALRITSQSLAYQAVDAIRSLGFTASLKDYPSSVQDGHRVYSVSVSQRNRLFDALISGACPDPAKDEQWVSVRTPSTAAYSGPVYDLTIEEDHSYVVEGQAVSNSFGIFFARTTAGSRERMEKLNISGFEEFVNAIRSQVRSFFQLLAMHIMELNPGKLTVLPSWSPNPMNTKSDAFMQELYKLKQIGAISTRTLLRYHGLDDDVEIRRIAQELALDVDDLTNQNVPLSYVQQSLQPDTGGEQPDLPTGVDPAKGPKAPKKVKTTAIPPTKQPGRPPK